MYANIIYEAGLDLEKEQKYTDDAIFYNHLCHRVALAFQNAYGKSTGDDYCRIEENVRSELRKLHKLKIEFLGEATNET